MRSFYTGTVPYCIPLVYGTVPTVQRHYRVHLSLITGPCGSAYLFFTGSGFFFSPDPAPATAPIPLKTYRYRYAFNHFLLTPHPPFIHLLLGIFHFNLPLTNFGTNEDNSLPEPDLQESNRLRPKCPGSGWLRLRNTVTDTV